MDRLLLRSLLALAGLAVVAGVALGAGALISADRPVVAAASGAPVTADGARGAAGAGAITVRRSRFGRVIFDGGGRALYLFTRERTARPRCYGPCAVAWPPLLVTRAPRAGAGARSALIGTTRRRDGTRQATYRGHPLYYYVDDREPGQILCHDVVEFGGTWLVVTPRGTAAA